MTARGAAEILIVGDVMTDIIVRQHGKVVHGSDRAATIRQSPGGSGANLAAWLGHLGGRVAFAGRAGTDGVQQHGAALRRHGVRPVLAADPDLPTGMLVTLLDPDGERSFLTDRGANDALCRADLPDALLDGVRLLQISGYSLFTPGPRAAVLDFAAAAKQRGVPWTVDAASSGFLAEIGPAAFLAWTADADTLIANVSEAILLTGTDRLDAQFAALGAPGRTVVLTRGTEGAAASGPDCAFCSAPAVSIVPLDSTGAGDAFLAGYLLGRLAGKDLQACLADGVRQGAQAASQLGGRPITIASSPQMETGRPV